MKWPAVVGLVFLGVYLLYTSTIRDDKFRFRITLEVEADGKIHTGSSVMEANVHRERFVPGSPGSASISVRGEAVVVDLGSRGLLFGILKYPGRGDFGAVVYDAFPPPGRGGGAALPDNLKRYQEQKLRTELGPKLIPILVRFADINDPKSVVQIDPISLTASYGPGVHLVRATIETTKDLTTGGAILQLLPWWRRWDVSKHLDGSLSRSTNAPAGSITHGDFRTGL